MKHRAWILSFLVALSALFVVPMAAIAQNATPGASPVASPAAPPPLASPVPLSSNVTVIAEGLNNPRGLEFAADGTIYVAEAGTGGTTSTVGQCDQVPAPLGPYTGGDTASISTVDPSSGQVTKLVDNLASTQTTAETGGDIIGVADVAVIDGQWYYLLAGGGCSHGHADTPNGVYKINADGTTALVADLSAFIQANPVAKPNAGDFEPDETWYTMLAEGGTLYVVGPNHGEVDKVDPTTGNVTRLVDTSATYGHTVPTSIALAPDGSFYVSTLDTYPISNGDASVYTVTETGDISTFFDGVTASTGIAVDSSGNIYVLETSGPASGGLPFTPGTGRIVELDSAGLMVTVIASGLTQPTGLTIGPDGNLYASNFGWGAPPGSGQIVKINITSSNATPQATPVA
jgi:sugar lactone lactonase YvrE